MTDPSQLSDAELFAIAGIQPRQAAQPAPRSTSSAPRGIRNNNPGNIEDGAFARSLPGYAGSDGRFARFDSPDAGNAAKAQLLGSYIRRGFDTPLEIINRWAPPSDNNPTQAYAAYVAQRVGIRPDQQVTPEQIPLLAQAIAEFENGQTVSQSSPAAQAPADVSQMSDEELLALAGETAPAPRQQTFRGRPVEITVSDPIQTDQAGAFDLTNPTASMDIRSLGRGDRVVLQDGTTRTLLGRPYNDNPRQGEEQVGGFNLRPPNTLDATGAYTSGAMEQIPFADEAAVGLSAMLNGQDYSTARDNYMADVARLNESQRGQRVAGGVTGFGLGLAAPGGSWVANGPAAVYRATRAGALGAGYGALYGAGAADGGLQERLRGGAIGAGTGLIAGSALQGAGDQLSRVASRAQPSAPRRLSRLGVDLTPGQALSDIPVLGPTVKYLEDIGAGFNPLMNGVSRQQNEQVIRAAGNEALGAIGESLSNDARTGFQVFQQTTQRLSDAYDEVLARTSAQADGTLTQDLGDMLNRASQTLDDSRLGRLNRILNDYVVDRFAQNGSLSGEQFKRIETTLRQQSERANRPNATLEDQDLGEFLDEARDIVRNLIARQNPAQAERIQAINRGWAVSSRIRRAVSGSAQMARDGTPTPGELTQTVRQMSSESQIGNQSALLQQLASDARSVLPSTIGDTGSGQRAVLGGLATLGTAGATAVNPALGLGILGGAAVYSKPGIGLFNAAYRLTDRPGATAEMLSRLALAARQNPALVPVYERALLQSQLGEGLQSRQQRQGPRGLFGATRPQTAQPQ